MNWALKFRKCIVCSTKKEQHAAHGMCKTCYRKHNDSEYKKIVGNVQDKDKKFSDHKNVMAEHAEHHPLIDY